MGKIMVTKENYVYGNVIETEYFVLEAEVDSLRQAIKRVDVDITEHTSRYLGSILTEEITGYCTYISHIETTLDKLDKNDKLNAFCIGTIIYRDSDISHIIEKNYYYFQ